MPFEPITAVHLDQRYNKKGYCVCAMHYTIRMIVSLSLTYRAALAWWRRMAITHFKACASHFSTATSGIVGEESSGEQKDTIFSRDSCQFPTELRQIATYFPTKGARKFNFAPKLTKNAGFSVPNLVFWIEIFREEQNFPPGYPLSQLATTPRPQLYTLQNDCRMNAKGNHWEQISIRYYTIDDLHWKTASLI